MYNKNILIWVSTVLSMFFSCVFSMNGNFLFNDRLFYNNSPWGSKVAKIEFKKKRIDALAALLSQIRELEKEISPEFANKRKLQEERVLARSKQLYDLPIAIRALQEKMELLKRHLQGSDQERDAVNRQIFETELELTKKNAELGAFLEEDKNSPLSREVNALLQELKKDPRFAKLEQYRDECLSNLAEAASERGLESDPWGILVAKALAGPNYNSALDDALVQNWRDGLLKGGAVLGIGVASETLRERVKGASDRYVGGFIDFMCTKLSDFGSKIINIMFHGSNEPFDSQKLEGWQKIVMCAYDDINNMLNGALRDSTRSLDSVSRQFADDVADGENEKDIDMWASLVAGYAEQFNFFIRIFEKHVEYYDPDDIVVFYSSQICHMLQITCKLLLSSRSLKDLDSKLESQKTIIPSIKKNIYNLFEQLKFEVMPRSYSIKDKATTSTPTYKPAPYNPYAGSGYASGYGTDMPTSYSQYAGYGI